MPKKKVNKPVGGYYVAIDIYNELDRKGDYKTFYLSELLRKGGEITPIIGLDKMYWQKEVTAEEHANRMYDYLADRGDVPSFYVRIEKE